MLAVAGFMIWYFFIRGNDSETITISAKKGSLFGTPKGKKQSANPEQAMLDFDKTAKRPISKKQALDLLINARVKERSELERYNRDKDYKHEQRARDWHRFAQEVEDYYSVNRNTLKGQNKKIVLL